MDPNTLPAVLYVDDDALNLRVFAANFSKRLNVITCASPLEALGILEQRRGEIGVVLTDQRMPGMTGVELLERARTLAPEARRMLVTAFADMQAVIDAVNRGQVSRYFVKPWDRAELLAALEDALRIARLEMHVHDVEGRLLSAERLATLGQVSAGIAHELMGPVAYITQNIATLRAYHERMSEYVHTQLQRAPAQHVVDILQDMPSLLADIETGARHVRQVAMGLRAQARGEELETTSDLSEVATFAVKLAGVQVRDRARLSTEGEPVRVVGGPVKLTQVLLNLIVNAAQAMEGIGRPGLIQLRWQRRDAEVVLTVSDNGAGIPAQLLDKVFQPFFTTKPVGVGTGLGLPICRDIVNQLGGSLALRSEEGSGTQVELVLRQAPPAPPRP